MKAVTVEPKNPGSAMLEEIPEPSSGDGSVLVEAVAVGVCGTDVEIVEGKYGWAPPGKRRLVLGHESLGRVIDPGPSGGFKKGDLVVGIVRRPDPVPCPNCAVGEWDMCRNGQYTERGIKQIDGFMSERWRIEPEYAMKVDSSLGMLGVLLEPTTVVTKAWEQVVAIGQRALGSRKRSWSPGPDRSVFSPHCWGCSTGWRSTSWTGWNLGPNPSSYARWERRTTPARWPMSGSSRMWSWNAQGLARSSPARSTVSPPEESCASRVWGPEVRFPEWPRPTPPQRPSSRTMRSSGASTPTSGTGTRPPKPLLERTGRGSRVL